MDNETKLWISAWSLLAATVCVIAITVCASDLNATAKFKQMVDSGADPVRVRCGLWGGSDRLDCNLLTK